MLIFCFPVTAYKTQVHQFKSCTLTMSHSIVPRPSAQMWKYKTDTTHTSPNIQNWSSLMNIMFLWVWEFCTQVRCTVITLIIRTIQLFKHTPISRKNAVFQAFEHPRLKLLFQYPNTYTSWNLNGGCRTSTSLQQSLRN